MTETAWKITEPGRSCARCPRRFERGAEYFSLLHVDRDRLVREDLCPGCFAGIRAAEARPIFWKTRRPADDREPLAVDLNALHRLFVRLLDEPNAETEALRYVIALLLLRKKVLKPVRTRSGMRGDLVFKDPRDPARELRLEAPELDPHTLERLKEQLGDLVDGAR